MPSVALVNPEIPPNTGNVARTCVATSTALYLVGKLGFSISDSQVKRAGLDYWYDLDLTYLETFEDLIEVTPGRRLLLFSTRGRYRHDEVDYRADDVLVFGPESKGLDEAHLADARFTTVFIPQWGPVRSLNLSNAVAIALYEAYRRMGFPETPPT